MSSEERLSDVIAYRIRSSFLWLLRFCAICYLFHGVRRKNSCSTSVTFFRYSAFSGRTYRIRERQSITTSRCSLVNVQEYRFIHIPPYLALSLSFVSLRRGTRSSCSCSFRSRSSRNFRFASSRASTDGLPLLFRSSVGLFRSDCLACGLSFESFELCFDGVFSFFDGSTSACVRLP